MATQAPIRRTRSLECTEKVDPEWRKLCLSINRRANKTNSEEKDVLGPVGSEMALVVSANYTGVASLCGTNLG